MFEAGVRFSKMPGAKYQKKGSSVAGYSGTPLPKKLGFKPGMRVALVDLAQVFSCPPLHPEQSRLSPEDFALLCDLSASEGIAMREKKEIERRLSELRMMYEPYLYAMSRYFLVSLPPWIPEAGRRDNWQTSPWGEDDALQSRKRRRRSRDDHF